MKLVIVSTQMMSMMMMIAFITLNSRPVPLIEGLCSSNHGFEFLVLRSHLLPFFFGRKYMFKKKQLVQDLIPAYIHMCTLYTYTKTYMSRYSPSGFFRPSRCLVPTPGLTSEYFTCSVCACVRIHTHVHQHTFPLPSKNRGKYRQHLYLSSCEK